MSGSRRYGNRKVRYCPTDGKTCFESYNQAREAVGRIKATKGDTQRIYWCSVAGAYHTSSHDHREADRRRAAALQNPDDWTTWQTRRARRARRGLS